VIYHRENRETHRTFEEYCKERWGFARRTAYQFIDSAKVIENVRNCAQIPQTESQARPLTKLPPAEQPMAFQKEVRQSQPKKEKIVFHPVSDAK